VVARTIDEDHTLKYYLGDTYVEWIKGYDDVEEFYVHLIEHDEDRIDTHIPEFCEELPVLSRRDEGFSEVLEEFGSLDSLFADLLQFRELFLGYLRFDDLLE